jgi:Tfp pilus assembly protein PilV
MRMSFKAQGFGWDKAAGAAAGEADGCFIFSCIKCNPASDPSELLGLLCTMASTRSAATASLP